MRSYLPWVALLLLARGALVLSLGDAFFYGEELEKAAAAKAMLDGLDLAHHHLAYHYYEGGGFVISHLKALAFLAFGETLLANKLVAALWCVGVLLAGCWACRQAFGEAAAHAFGGLYVFAPVTVQKLSLISLGIHHEACLFILISLGLASRLLEKQEIRSSALLGLCVGFGVYFSWVVALAGAACGLALLWRWRSRVDPRCVGALVVGGLVGAAPLWIMVSLVGDAVFDIHGTGLASTAERSLSVNLRDFLRSIYIEGALGGVLGALVWPAAVLSAAIFCGRGGVDFQVSRRRQAGLFSLFMVVFLVAYLSSAFVQGSVYHFFLMLRLVPLWIVGACLVAAAVGRAWETRAEGGAFAWVGAGLAAVGVFGLWGGVWEGQPRSMSQNLTSLNEERGYVYSSYFEKLIPHIPGDTPERLRVLLGFDEDDPALLREAIASELFRRRGVSLEEDYAYYLGLVEAVEPGRFSEYQLGLGPLLSAWLGTELRSSLTAVQAAGMDASALAEALGRTGRGLRTRKGDPTLDGAVGVLLDDLGIVEGVPGDQAFARGAGWRLHLVLRRTVYQPWRVDDVLGAAPVGLRSSFREGYEAAVGAGLLSERS
ncbi:MAG: hypothetical protein MK297_11780 [Planctomycetes bacterium]|nr:hypothetical protein [Planctomycetota bacterium]